MCQAPDSAVRIRHRRNQIKIFTLYEAIFRWEETERKERKEKKKKRIRR